MQQAVQRASDTRAIDSVPSQQAQRRKTRAYNKLYQAIRAGHGQGHGAAYQPWLQLRRKNSSPDSNQVVSWMPLLNRPAHYLSRGEYQTALLLLWLDVSDLREQYPIWPFFHPHPLHGAPEADGLAYRFTQGLLSIAQAAGIDHGEEIGSGLPYVATLDFLITIPGKQGPRLAIFSSKPVSEGDDMPKWRMLERLELERRYAEEISAQVRL
ncbi:MAG TPA: TnsA endonuclease N-terminal domain-containing protein, partial [Rhodocyclaceae bacterium]|nr:TnsA endonuclease N-terminal domain-containing protein [Rhodocyclaceae bacterium]